MIVAETQVKTHSYHPEGQLAWITYTNSQFTIPNISFTYDTYSQSAYEFPGTMMK